MVPGPGLSPSLLAPRSEDSPRGRAEALLSPLLCPSAFPLPTPAAHRGDKEPEVPSGPREEVVEAGWRPGPFLQPLGFKAGMSPGSGRVWRGVAFPQGERLSPALWRAGAGRTP